MEGNHWGKLLYYKPCCYFAYAPNLHLFYVEIRYLCSPWRNEKHWEHHWLCNGNTTLELVVEYVHRVRVQSVLPSIIHAIHALYNLVVRRKHGLAMQKQYEIVALTMITIDCLDHYHRPDIHRHTQAMYHIWLFKLWNVFKLNKSTHTQQQQLKNI